MLTPLLALTLSLSPPVQEDAPFWRGCWTTATDPPQVLWFEEGRCGWLREHQPTFYRTQESEAGVRLESWGRVQKLALALEGDTLRVRTRDVELELTRAEVPSALLVETFDWPADVEVDADTVAELRESLRHRRLEDQRVRIAMSAKGSTPERMSEVASIDGDNTRFLKGIVAELGWIDAVRFGTEASDAAFLLVQHSGDLRLMSSALPLIEVDVRAGRLEGQAFALLHDRLQLNLGYRQRYGSQLGTAEDGTLVLLPCEDPERIDELRATMGMGPLAEYLELFRESETDPLPRRLEAVLDGGR